MTKKTGTTREWLEALGPDYEEARQRLSSLETSGFSDEANARIAALVQARSSDPKTLSHGLYKLARELHLGERPPSAQPPPQPTSPPTNSGGVSFGSLSARVGKAVRRPKNVMMYVMVVLAVISLILAGPNMLVGWGLGRGANKSEVDPMPTVAAQAAVVDFEAVEVDAPDLNEDAPDVSIEASQAVAEFFKVWIAENGQIVSDFVRNPGENAVPSVSSVASQIRQKEGRVRERADELRTALEQAVEGGQLSGDQAEQYRQVVGSTENVFSLWQSWAEAAEEGKWSTAEAVATEYDRMAVETVADLANLGQVVEAPPSLVETQKVLRSELENKSAAAEQSASAQNGSGQSAPVATTTPAPTATPVPTPTPAVVALENATFDGLSYVEAFVQVATELLMYEVGDANLATREVLEYARTNSVSLEQAVEAVASSKIWLKKTYAPGQEVALSQLAEAMGVLGWDLGYWNPGSLDVMYGPGEQYLRVSPLDYVVTVAGDVGAVRVRIRNGSEGWWQSYQYGLEFLVEIPDPTPVPYPTLVPTPFPAPIATAVFHDYDGVPCRSQYTASECGVCETYAVYYWEDADLPAVCTRVVKVSREQGIDVEAAVQALISEEGWTLLPRYPVTD